VVVAPLALALAPTSTATRGLQARKVVAMAASASGPWWVTPRRIGAAPRRVPRADGGDAREGAPGARASLDRMAADAARRTRDPSAPNDPAVEAAFEAAPDDVVAEILDGELHLSPRPARRHANASSVLGGELHGPFRRGQGGPGGWVILFEPEIHLGRRPDKIVPDLAGWRRERMPDAIGAADAPAHFDLAPDWACEVLSPRNEGTDRGKRYASTGARASGTCGS
jgi:Uma2 family endonuclease